MMTRPVLIVGPLADTVVDKLVSEHPNGMVRCQPEYVDSDMKALEKGVMDNVFVDFKRRGSHYECTTVSSIREICDRVSCFLESVRGTTLSLCISRISIVSWTFISALWTAFTRTRSIPSSFSSSSRASSRSKRFVNQFAL